MYFVWRRNKEWKMKNITKPINPKNPLVNDYAMNYQVQKHFKTNQDVLDRKFLAGQISRQMKDMLEMELKE